MVDVELDFRKSAQENIAEYFEEAKHARTKLKSAVEAMAETQKKLDAPTETLDKIASSLSVKPIRKKLPAHWFEKMRWTLSEQGFLIIGGRDATQNEIVYKKYIEKDDLVLHADIAGAPLVVIKSQGKEIPLDTIKEAAHFAGVYSKAWKLGVGTVEVYWIKPDQVSKDSGLPKGAFMISGKRNYLRAEMKLGIGIKEGKIIVGTPESIKALCGFVIKIAPGQKSSAQLAKSIKIRVLKMTDDESVMKIPIQDFQRVIPGGGGQII